MFGADELKNILGSLTIGLLIEAGIAIAGIMIVYNKLKNKIIGSYKERKQQEDDIKEALTGARSIPACQKTNLEIQNKLKETDKEILDLCKKIQDNVKENQQILNKRLDKLEDREKNALRSKILDQHRLFTNKKKNPMLAWSEMERDSFFHLVKDYESLKGNDYVHSVVIPDMNKLDVIKMSDLEKLTEMYHSREE